MTTAVESTCPIWCDDCSDLGDGVVLHQKWIRGSRWEVQAGIEITPQAARRFVWFGTTDGCEAEHTPEEAADLARDLAVAAVLATHLD